MFFDKDKYSDEAVEVNGSKLFYRAYRNIVFVEKPADGFFHRMNIYVPLAYYRGENINGYNLKTAPVFMPNDAGGYKPAGTLEPSESEAIKQALLRGYAVVSPAVRGRDLKDGKGRNYGKAPACIIDYKAAVRYLHFFEDDLPGDENKIITNGTSAGGALSCLMGVTGNHPDYEEYLKEIGAADARDDVFAASCYCPITNLDNADMAYEWQFDGIYNYRRKSMKITEGGRPDFTAVDGVMSDEQIQLSKELSGLFPDYVNSLNLKDEKGRVLTLNEKGNGSFKEYIEEIILSSAQKALDKGADLSDKSWLEIKKGKAVRMNFEGFAKDITRMKTTPAFDDVTMTSGENHLFGGVENDYAHFTEFGRSRSKAEGIIAEPKIIKMMNPMYYIDDPKAQSAKYFRIRHGECDRDTSLAVSAILNLKLKEAGCSVDYASPWDTPHSGDYDLEELFEWADKICRHNSAKKP